MLILAGVAISTLTGDNGLFARISGAADEYNKSVANEADAINQMLSGDYWNSTNEPETVANTPELKAGMIPVYYDEAANVWKKADENNANDNWYNYTEQDKKWANIVLVSDAKNTSKGYRTAATDTPIEMEDIEAFFVWIPRYAYSIVNGYKTEDSESVSDTNANPTKKISVSFLNGATNTDSNGKTYARDYDIDSIAAGGITPKIVHPGFTFGNQELSGIWVGKFEVSGKTSTGQYVGNSDGTANAQKYAPDSTTHVQIVPNAISWRYTTIGEAQYQAMKMGESSTYYGWNDVNSHLIKNSEWGAVAYLCYSKYGQVPQINGAGKRVTIGTINVYYDFMTGAGPKANGDESRYETYTYEANGYYTNLGKLASTTGNVYGIYDINGGAYERVAGYLDNKNTNLNAYGKSTSDESVAYFENGELKSEYTAYWDKYEVSEEERNNAIEVSPSVKKTQAELWVADVTTINWNEARKRLTDATFEKMKKHKGIGMNETAGSYGFYGVRYDGTVYGWNWFKTVVDAEANTVTSRGSWNSDCTRVGHIVNLFVSRGGSCDDGASSGVLTSYVTNGATYSGNRGSRVVVCP